MKLGMKTPQTWFFLKVRQYEDYSTRKDSQNGNPTTDPRRDLVLGPEQITFINVRGREVKGRGERCEGVCTLCTNRLNWCIRSSLRTNETN